MSKRLPNVNAKSFEEVLARILPTLVKMRDADVRTDDAQMFDFNPIEGRDELVEALKKMVNTDICLTDKQHNRLSADMVDYLQYPDQTKLLAMVAVINSYRNECFRCLNNECDKRDPQTFVI